ncbi:ATP-binding protein [Streptomyces sp. AD55]|uniref:ATP-binding protein n=1 Tax=Streptomyces sp. AD55 TaxID=3242895 RepID=UPI003527ECA2
MSLRHRWSRYATDGTVVGMTTEPMNPVDLTGITGPADHTEGPADGSVPASDRSFGMRFTSTPRGARLARRLAAVRLEEWGVPYGTVPHDAVVLIVAELAANAVRHGCVPGRDFRLALEIPPGGRLVRIEVTDARAERLPRRPGAPGPAEEPVEGGRGLLIVAHLATRWGCDPRPGGPGKVVWAEYALP